jgi:hypothetical protein
MKTAEAFDEETDGTAVIVRMNKGNEHGKAADIAKLGDNRSLKLPKVVGGWQNGESESCTHQAWSNRRYDRCDHKAHECRKESEGNQ